jgi:hypothetical protein
MQNRRRTSPNPQSSPKPPGLPTRASRWPNPEPNTAFRRQHPAAIPKLPNPVPRRRTIRIDRSRAPIPNALANTQNTVQAGLNDLG